MKRFVKYLLYWFIAIMPCLLNAQQNLDEPNRTIDSLLNVLTILTSPSPEITLVKGSDTSQINTLNLLSSEYVHRDQYEKALQYAQEALKYAGTINFPKGLANTHHLLGLIYSTKGNYELALENYQKSLKIRMELGDKKATSNSFNNIGTIYLSQGNYEKALDNYFKALKIREEIGWKYGAATCYSNIGEIYSKQRNYKKALECYQNCLKISEETDSKVGIAISYINIGSIYEEEGDYKNTLDNYLRSLRIAEKLGHEELKAASFTSIASVYKKFGHYEMALDNLLKSLKIYEKIGEKEGIANSYCSIGTIYFKKGIYEASINYLNKALISYKEMGNKEGIKEVYSSLSDLFYKKNDYKQAYNFHKLYSDIKDTLLNAQSGKQIAEMATKYDSEQKDKAIQLLNKDKETQVSLRAEEKKRQRIILFSVSGFSFLLIVFSIFIYRSFRQKQKLNKELETLSIVASETVNSVLICGPKGEIEWCNTGLTRILGYTVEDLKLKGNTLEEISASPEIKSLIHQSIENKKPSSYQALNITKDGKRRWMQSTLTPILDELGNIKKLVVIDMDVTERKQADDEIKQKNQNITDSINYAKRIQQAILPSNEMIKSCIPESFIFFKPKNIVSGDFYWIHAIDKSETLFAAVDCTGHGVPGALMSMMGYNLLEQIVKGNRIYEPAMILDELSKLVIQSLRQTAGLDAVKDGMDISICKINYLTNELEYAGAHNPLYLIRNGTLIETKADRKSIGISPSKSGSFSNHKIKLEKGDCLYIFSDGYADQKGGPYNEKIFYQPFRELIINIHLLPMDDQQERLEKVISEWKGDQEQIDDMLVIGVKI